MAALKVHTDTDTLYACRWRVAVAVWKTFINTSLSFPKCNFSFSAVAITSLLSSVCVCVQKGHKIGMANTFRKVTMEKCIINQYFGMAKAHKKDGWFANETPTMRIKVFIVQLPLPLLLQLHRKSRVELWCWCSWYFNVRPAVLLRSC